MVDTCPCAISQYFQAQNGGGQKHGLEHLCFTEQWQGRTKTHRELYNLNFVLSNSQPFRLPRESWTNQVTLELSIKLADCAQSVFSPLQLWEFRWGSCQTRYSAWLHSKSPTLFSLALIATALTTTDYISCRIWHTSHSCHHLFSRYRQSWLHVWARWVAYRIDWNIRPVLITQVFFIFGDLESRLIPKKVLCVWRGFSRTTCLKDTLTLETDDERCGLISQLAL